MSPALAENLTRGAGIADPARFCAAACACATGAPVVVTSPPTEMISATDRADGCQAMGSQLNGPCFRGRAAGDSLKGQVVYSRTQEEP
jgi:hypothetical protein